MNHSLKVQHEKKYFVALLYQHKKKQKKLIIGLIINWI